MVDTSITWYSYSIHCTYKTTNITGGAHVRWDISTILECCEVLVATPVCLWSRDISKIHHSSTSIWAILLRISLWAHVNSWCWAQRFQFIYKLLYNLTYPLVNVDITFLKRTLHYFCGHFPSKLSVSQRVAMNISPWGIYGAEIFINHLGAAGNIAKKAVQNSELSPKKRWVSIVMFVHQRVTMGNIFFWWNMLKHHWIMTFYGIFCDVYPGRKRETHCSFWCPSHLSWLSPRIV